MALMGNVVVWKPSDSQVFSAKVIMDVFKEAGVPDGVINVVFGDPKMITDTVLASPDFSGLHFTGSTFIFKELWKQIGENIHNYKTYPKIVGETGGKDFIVAHKSANAKQVATAIARGSFEFQGQKCSAASRAYIPQGIWADVKKYLIEDAIVASTLSLRLTDNWIEFNLRYVVDYKKRRFTKNAIFIEILDEITKTNGKVELASATFEVVGIPKLNIDFANK